MHKDPELIPTYQEVVESVRGFVPKRICTVGDRKCVWDGTAVRKKKKKFENRRCWFNELAGLLSW